MKMLTQKNEIYNRLTNLSNCEEKSEELWRKLHKIEFKISRFFEQNSWILNKKKLFYIIKNAIVISKRCF